MFLTRPPRNGPCLPGCPGPVSVTVPLPSAHRLKSVVYAFKSLRTHTWGPRAQLPEAGLHQGKLRTSHPASGHSWNLSSLRLHLRSQNSGFSGQRAHCGVEAGSWGRPCNNQAVVLVCPRAVPGHQERSTWSCAMHTWPAVHCCMGTALAWAQTITERKERK